MPSTHSKRLRILSDSEYKEIYGLPKFNQELREVFFSLTANEMKVVESLGSVKSKVYFILQLGYFKVSPTFHEFTFDEVKKDTKYIYQHYFKYKQPDVIVGSIWRKNTLEQRKLILELCKYKPYNPQTKEIIKTKLKQLVRIHANHVDIFRELLTHLEIRRIMLPRYLHLQDLMGEAISLEQQRLSNMIRRHIGKPISLKLNSLLEVAGKIRKFTALKKHPKNFNLTELKNEASKCAEYQDLYQFSKTLLPKLKISNQCIKYYANLAEQSDLHSLKSKKLSIAQLYLLCYMYHRFQLICDNLILIFFYHINNFKDDMKQYANQKAFEYRMSHDKNLPKVGKVLKLIADKSRPKESTFGDFQDNAFDILPENQYSRMAAYISGESFDGAKCEWDYVVDKARTFKQFFRPIILNIAFTSDKTEHPVLTSITFIKAAIAKGKSLSQIDTTKFPREFIPASTLKYLRDFKLITVKNKKGELVTKKLKIFQPDKYEFLIYRELFKFLDKGKIFCSDTTQYKSLKDDLVSDEVWKDKDKLLPELGYPNIMVDGPTRLSQLKTEFNEKMDRVNQRILNGENKDIKISGKGDGETWTLPYPKMENEINNPFYDKIPKIGIGDLLMLVDQKCNYKTAFTHIRPQYSKFNVDINHIIACITAQAFNYGIEQMSEMCDMKYTELFLTNKNYMRVETIKTANDIVSNFIAGLPIFRYWNITSDFLLGAVDGQKYETQIQTLQSRYSSKYFGLSKGIVAYHLVVNHVPVNTNIIGANDHESHFVFDIVYNNTSVIDPTAISGDQHSTNQLNYAVLDAINKSFFPNYRNTPKKANKSIYCFKELHHYKDYFLKPIRRTSEKLIVDEWDNIQRIFASLVMQKTTQSIIVKKLSSHVRNSPTKRALWEFNNILMSLHILDVIDDPTLRSNIRRSLNRIEGYHQLRRAIAKVGGGKFRGTTIMANEICNQCGNLVANCIILYNALILNDLFLAYEQKGDLEQLEMIKRLSPIAWQHILLGGKYEFRKMKVHLGIEVIVAKLIQNLEENST